MARRYRLAILMSHPVPYQVPLWRRMASHPALDPMVYYFTDHGTKPALDKEYGRALAWDDDLTSGYPHRFLPNRARRPGPFGFWGCVNPSLHGEIRAGRYDAVLSYGYAFASNWIALAACETSGTPVLMRGDSELLTPRSARARALKRLVLPFLYRRVSGFLTVGRFNEDYYRHYGVPDGRLFRAVLAIDNESVAQRVAAARAGRGAARRALGLPEEPPVILFLGKLAPRKRPMDLLEAFMAAFPEGGASLLFVGDGAEHDRLRARATALGPGRVAFSGFRNSSEIPALLAASDLMVLPSEHDPKALVVNEAMVAGLPVVISDRVGHYAPGDLVRPGLTGEVFPVGDRTALAAILSRILQDPATCREMGRRAAEAVAAVSYDATIEGFLGALATVAADRAGDVPVGASRGAGA